jgi:DNA (cytosine-5)-methyltransferase 1
MGFPEDFAIPVSDTQAYRQFGNSVVMPVVEFLAIHLADRYLGRVLAPAA